jgi:flagellar basal-body rod protein FlgC
MSIANAIAVSGMNVATLRLQVSARNVANSLSNTESQQVDQAGALAATVQPSSQALIPAYTSKGPGEDARAFATSPYVELTNEMVQQLLARFDLTANAQVFRADVRMQAALLYLFD